MYEIQVPKSGGNQQKKWRIIPKFQHTKFSDIITLLFFQQHKHEHFTLIIEAQNVRVELLDLSFSSPILQQLKPAIFIKLLRRCRRNFAEQFVSQNCSRSKQVASRSNDSSRGQSSSTHPLEPTARTRNQQLVSQQPRAKIPNLKPSR